MKEQLLFVYNADSDLFSTVTDFAHKIISPSTYDCHLCALTYGSLNMKQEWKTFIEGLPLKTVFLHKDEFKKKYKSESIFPSVFIIENETINVLITKEEIISCKSLEEMKNLVTEKLKLHDQYHHTDIQ
ncbi:MAG: hypothetical protein ABIQ31_18910 [Ferruginibacter sp.]